MEFTIATTFQSIVQRLQRDGKNWKAINKEHVQSEDCQNPKVKYEQKTSNRYKSGVIAISCQLDYT